MLINLIIRTPVVSLLMPRITIIHFVLAGCFCPTGYVEKDDLCVRPEECDLDICSLSPETGVCLAYFPRYFYNSTSGECELFIYGGCQGNSNNFDTIEQCESTCKGMRICNIVYSCIWTVLWCTYSNRVPRGHGLPGMWDCLPHYLWQQKWPSWNLYPPVCAR